MRPFQDLDPLARGEGWGQGLTDDLVVALARADGVQVRLDRSGSPPESGVWLEGSARREGSTAVLSCRASEAGTVLCADTCRVDVSRRLAAQRRVAESVAAAGLELVADGSR